MLSCDKATFLISKEQESEISVIEKIQLKLHLMACKFCKLYKKESSFISKNIDHMHQHSDKCFSDYKLDDSSKSAMQQAIKEQLNKGSEEN